MAGNSQILYPETGTTSFSVTNSREWINPEYITSNDIQYSTVTNNMFLGTNYSYYLNANNFGFTIPYGSTINGIVVSIRRKSSTLGLVKFIRDYEVYLIKSNGSFGSENKAQSGVDWSAIAFQTVSYGGASDSWSESLSALDVNNPNFGVSLMVSITSDSDKVDITGFVNYIDITVYYTDPLKPQYLSHPFAVNTGSTISGTSQVYNLAIGTTQQDYSGQPGGVIWYGGPDETTGYIIAKDNGNFPTFWRTINKTQNGFLNLVDSIKKGTPLPNVTEALDWLDTNEYYTDYPV